MSKLLTYISLFSSAGVGCFGFKQNDFECIATNELLPKRLKIQRINNKCKYESGYLEGDITTKELKEKLFIEIDRWKRLYKITEPDVVIATPPCQGMSVANHKKNDESKRNSLVVESIKIIKEVKPKFFVFENVRAFLTTLCTDIDGSEKPIAEAIYCNLGGEYHIVSKVLNFKDYGSNSSRTRTLVIGIRKDLQQVSAYDIFPSKEAPKTLRELFKELEILKEMGQISKTDIFHSYRAFNPKMIAWIELLKEGESAFQNKEAHRIPHQVKNGIVLINAKKNGDKYARWFWDKEGPCIHTRNDILASQNTIHPSENRVFSIRELMMMMSIPESFQWTNISLNELNFSEKKEFLKKEEMNIRQCIGEAVPTAIFYKIAENIKCFLNKKNLTTAEINTIVKEKQLDELNKILPFINKNIKKLGIDTIFQIAEYANANRLKNAAFFTRKDIAFSVINSLPDLKDKKSIRILEPSVGIGNFLPLLVQKYEDKEEIVFDIVDIDSNSLLILQTILKHLQYPKKYKFNFINDDFLTHLFQEKYDVVVGNPPYGKVNNSKLLASYKQQNKNKGSNNLFAFFIEKALALGTYVSLIVPKSLINAPEFDTTRKVLEQHNLLKVIDYGEKGFKDVKIETISFLVDTTTKKEERIIIESYINNSLQTKSKEYVFNTQYPYWLIYRNEDFDKVASKMTFDIFSSFRDRQITKHNTKALGRYRVLKSRNIGSNEIINIDGYDTYIDDIEKLNVAKYLNKKNVVMVPNLTYNPRAAFLPKNTITDGSVALLTLKNNNTIIDKEDLAYYNTIEFQTFYKIARNFGTRSLNIDNNSVFFFGVLKK